MRGIKKKVWLRAQVRKTLRSETEQRLKPEHADTALSHGEVGKGQAGGQPLPVVAVGAIPHIYRRAFFTHRATP